MLVDTATQAIRDVHCTTTKRHDTQLGCTGRPPHAGDLYSLAGTGAMIGWHFMRNYVKRRETADQASTLPARRLRA